MARLGSWIESHPEGIYVRPADAWIDPSQPKERAWVTHGHGDHARGGHGAVLATPETLAIMEVRYGPQKDQSIAVCFFAAPSWISLSRQALDDGKRCDVR